MSRLYRLLPAALLGAFMRPGQGGGIAPSGTVATVKTGGGSGGDPTAPSPTGRNPTFLWTPEQQYVFNRMRTDNHYHWALVKSNADKTGTASQRYGDTGQWCTYVYQTTGDVAYATKAWNALYPVINLATASVGANNCRENFTFYCILVDWLWPALNATQRGQAMAALKNWADYAQAVGLGPYSGGFSFADSDPLFGYYGGLVALHYFNVPENTLYGVALTRNSRSIPMGGLDATTAPTNSVRYKQWELVTNYATGGEWMESSEYNHGTSMLAFLLWRVAASVSATDMYPELATYFANYPYKTFHDITPDFEQIVYWGDEQDPRTFNVDSYRYARIWGRMAGHIGAINLTNSAAASYALALSDAFYTKWAAALQDNNAPDRTFFYFNPYLNRGTLPTAQSSWYASGQRQERVKDSQSLFWIYSPPRMGIDHNLPCGTHWQLWRDGAWIVREPQAYDTNPNPVYVQWSNMGKNALEFAGLEGNMHARGLTRRETGTAGGVFWTCHTSNTSGSYYAPSYFNPPASFVTSAERRVLYWKDAATGHDVVVEWDQVDALDPLTLGNFSRYRTSPANHQLAITNKDAVKVVTKHMTTQPSVASQVATWTTTGIGGIVTTATCHTLLPASATIVVRDETVDVLPTGHPGWKTPERRWQTRVWETSEQQVTTFLHVTIAGNGTQPAISGASASGVTIGARTVTFGPSSTTVT